MERADKDQIERVINHTMRERFGLGTAERAVLLEQTLRNCRRIPRIFKILVHETMAN